MFSRINRRSSDIIMVVSPIALMVIQRSKATIPPWQCSSRGRNSKLLCAKHRKLNTLRRPVNTLTHTHNADTENRKQTTCRSRRHYPVQMDEAAAEAVFLAHLFCAPHQIRLTLHRITQNHAPKSANPPPVLLFTLKLSKLVLQITAPEAFRKCVRR